MVRTRVIAAKKIRLDERLVADGLAESRAKAQALVTSGFVAVDGAVIDKPGTRVAPEAARMGGALPAWSPFLGGIRHNGPLSALGCRRKVKEVGFEQLGNAGFSAPSRAGRRSQSAHLALSLRDVDPPDRLMAISLRHEPRVQILEVCLQRLPVLLLRDPIHAHRRILAHAVIGSFQGRHIGRCASEWNRPSGSRCARSTTSSSSGDMLPNVEALDMVPS